MNPSTVQTTAEPAGKDRVRLRVEVPEAALDPAIARVYRRWAEEIKVPGFRKGKVPRPLIDARVGPEAVRDEAVRDALPGLFRDALAAEELEAIAPPELEVVSAEPGAPLIFEAIVDIRPEIVVPDFGAITVEAPPSEVTDAELDEQLDRLRDRFAELETVPREARRGDHVLIDLNGSIHGEPVEGVSAPDLLYEVGSRSGPPRLDDEIEGNRPGAILKFTDRLPEGSGDLAGQDVSFTVLLKEVKAKKLPALDDGFAKTVGEFDTLDALRDDLRGRMAGLKREMVEQEIAERAIAALVDASALEPPDKLVEGEFEHRLKHFEDDLRRAGLTLDEYGRRSQMTELEIRRDIRAGVVRSVTAELLLEEIARRNGIEVTNEDLGREIAVLAARSGRDPKELARELAGDRSLSALAADIIRRKALEFVVESVNVTGRPETTEKEPTTPAGEADPS